MTHTPTPWELGEIDEYGGYDCMTAGVKAGPVYLDGDDYGQRHHDITPDQAAAMLKDAAFIVKAVNAHDKLVEVLRKFMDYSDQEYVPNALFDRASVALEGLE